MSDKNDKSNDHEIKIFPDLTKFARNQQQAEIFENIENIIDCVNIFLTTNKKKDYEAAKKQIDMTSSMIQESSRKGQINDQSTIDVIHDSMLVPLYIMKYTENKNS